ncbi:lysozyme c-1-like isoform X1 [Ruditapes philippinarum]|uniref:lysozyme c-1-like isoform X1 n=1 Tax=Ruditapes philippinarum TaxID=129788 RepID=UPI00295BC16F|nr:lysozyme c-1-like isoform X1 [Ruditapes philippinarum]
MLEVKMLAVLLMTIVVLDALIFTPTKTKCEVVDALRKAGAREEDLRNWVCLVEQESGYQYNLRHYNDSGIFQLNDIWCDRPSGYFGTTCWMLNTYGCSDTCSSLLNEDISNDAYCAVRIKQCKGFSEWARWANYCRDLTSARYDYSEC